MKDIFANTISRIDFIDGMIRIELVTLSPSLDSIEGGGDGQGASIKVRYALYMPLGGFMRSALTQEKFIQEMVSRGILLTPAAPSQAAEDSTSPVSPDFI
ncbi:hypothetical protein PHAMO_380058 [Magnetospirillum molischianum DSM 120]|uniref:Uncharacterized protein n=2 Tax=Magnetospirillum molischianum TaxID=1083 RepID=H8FVK2_MAGML|nr:hypothetical protein PHAMO_380058 [Magnetospirillum molischianum DSM 120]